MRRATRARALSSFVGREGWAEKRKKEGAGSSAAGRPLGAPPLPHGRSPARAFSSTSFRILGYCGKARSTLWQTSTASTILRAFR